MIDSLAIHRGTPRLWLQQRHVELLLLTSVFMLPFGETSHIPVAVLVVLSVRALIRRNLAFDADARLFAWVAAALIVPLLVSAFGAYDPQSTLRTALVFGLYALAGLYAIDRLRARFDANLLVSGIGAILLFWTADALLQASSGRNVFGWPYNGYRVTGIYKTNMWIGYTMAHLSPFFLEALRRAARGPCGRAVWLLVLPFFAVILLSGGRAAWVTMGLVVPIYLVWLLRIGEIRVRHLASVGAAVAIVAAISIAASPELKARVDETLLAFSGTAEGLNTASSRRLEVWRGAWLLYQEAPVLGLGAHAYDPLVYERGYTVMPFSHTHLYGLDVLLSTGLVGFLAFMGAFGLLCVRVGGALARAAATLPPWLAAASILFPLNAHWNFYAPRPASLLWLLLIMAAAWAASERARSNAR